MPELKCEAMKCLYNIDNLCAKIVINVGINEATSSSETSCFSFTKREKMTPNDFKTEFASFIEPKLATEINCVSANCLYNRDYICNAKRVLVVGKKATDSKETNCDTFKLY